MSFTAISPSGNRLVTFWKLADAIELLTGQIASGVAGHKKDNIPRAPWMGRAAVLTSTLILRAASRNT
jgi:hypothetical protein